MQEHYLLIIEKRENSKVFIFYFFYVFEREFREEMRENLPRKVFRNSQKIFFFSKEV